MNYQDYQLLIEEILNTEPHPHPYDDEAYINYTRLNQARMKRWDKQLILDEVLINEVKSFTAPQHWIIITEPWCGDAAHILPFLMKLVAFNELITYELQLRDSEPFLIDSYLSWGTKSIPKMIVRDVDGNDLFTWGPRPAGAQTIMNELKAAGEPYATIKIALQNWYNADKGVSICKELLQCFRALKPIT